MNRDQNGAVIAQPKTELSKLSTNDFVLKNYRSKNSLLIKSKSVKDLFEYDEKGLLIMK